jgi:hypothetical protein
MTKLKTQKTDADVTEFIETFVNTEEKNKDSFELIHLIQNCTGFVPKMWGGSIIGFGQYQYKSSASKQEIEWFLVGFSPRKTAISLYVYNEFADQEALLNSLGKFKMGKSCIYIKKLSDINTHILQKLVLSTIEHLKENNKDVF